MHNDIIECQQTRKWEVEESYVTKTELREALKEVNANNNPVLLQKMDSIYKTQ